MFGNCVKTNTVNRTHSLISLNTDVTDGHDGDKNIDDNPVIFPGHDYNLTPSNDSINSNRDPEDIWHAHNLDPHVLETLRNKLNFKGTMAEFKRYLKSTMN